MQRLWAPHLPSYGSVDATTSLHPVQDPQPLGARNESLRVASFQAQENNMDPEGTAGRSSSLFDLGGSPALLHDAESASSLGNGSAPALENMHDDKSSASNSASSSEGHMSSKHKLSNVVTQLVTVVTCLQDCISTLVELQSDSFNQKDADAHLGMRESSLDSLTSSRNIGNNNNSNKTQEERSSLGELTPRTCKSKSDETGSHPELEPEELEQTEAEQQEQEEAEAEQLPAQQKGPAEQQQQQQQQQPLAYTSTWEHYSHKQLPKHKRWCNICWKRGHTTEACWYNNQQQTQQHHTAWMTPSGMQQQTAAASVKETELRPYKYSLTLGDQPMRSLQQSAQASTQQLACISPEHSTKNSLGQHKNIGGSWAILVDTGAAISVAPRSFAPEVPLRALERPVELRTATGEAIPIFGKKTMHLLTPNLCFEISFVIANVTTPILGVDTLLRENLSLRFEGCQRQLVHQSGEFTQLIQEGKLLYLRASPIQVGSTICMIGSLLDKSILPENKLEQAASGVRAKLSKREVLDKGGAYGHSFSQENLDNDHTLGKNKTALGTTASQQLGQQTACKEKKNKSSAKESSHQQLGMRRQKQKGQQTAASELRNLRKTKSINKIELALEAAEKRTSLGQETRLDLSFRFLLTFSLINQWQIATAKVSPAYQEGLASTISLEELGLRTCAADSNIFFGDQLLIMQFQGELLIGGAQLQQEALIVQLSALGLLQETTQLDHNTPVIFQNKILEYNKLEHSISLHTPLAFYMQLLERHNLEHETATNLPQEELAPKASRQNKQVLDAKQQELYKNTVGQLLWSRACRPDTSYAVDQLRLSLANPTAQDQDQLFCLLRYLKGTMHYSLILQPWHKKSLEKARFTELLAYSATSWTKGASPTSTACLSCWV